MITSMLRRAMLSGDGSTLNLDFTQMSTLADLTSRGLTFSRSTSGTYLNASGLVATATAGNPRFEYDGNGNALGLLSEASATNLVYHSETFRLTAVASEPYWADSASISRVTDTAPDGTAGAAVSFVAIGTAGTVIQTAAVGSSATRTLSFWAKRSGGGSVEYTLDNGSTWTAVTITGSWVRYTATATTANQRVGFRVAIGTSTSIWGAQLEVGTSSSSYITSGASQGTRGSDNCYADPISSWYTQGIGTMLFVGRPTVPTARTALNFSAGTSVPRLQIYGSGSTDLACYLENPAGTGANILFPTGTLVNNTIVKVAWAFETGNHAACINGGTVATATTSSPAVPSSGITRLNIGRRYDGVNQFNGHVIVAKYYPTRLTNAQLQAITT